MRLKSTLIFILLMIAVIATTIYAYEQMNTVPAELSRNVTTTINSARYIMFGGNYEVTQNNKNIELESGVFKLDTYTGKAWILRVQIENGQRTEKWLELFHEKQLEVKTKIPHSPIRGLTE